MDHTISPPCYDLMETRHKEQQTSDNLIIKDSCFITETFDKCSFSGTLRGCLSHLNEAWKV